MLTDDIRGVNLGGWLVIEKWITPSLFDGLSAQDEFTLSTELGPKEARRRLEKHREGFITRKHVAEIKKLGLNAVRVPVGYWLFEDTDGFIGGGDKYIDKLFEWAKEFDLQVLLCLHGVPGSQNGWDHSGRAGEIGWHSVDERYELTLGVIRRLAERYGSNEKLWGIEVVNEPHRSLPLSRLLRYYRLAGRIVRQLCHSSTRWVVSDAFRPSQVTRRLIVSWFRRPVLDQHLYQLFTPEDRNLDLAGHIDKTVQWGEELRRRRKWLPIIVGEWSAAMGELYQPELKTKAREYTNDQYIDYAHKQQIVFEQSRCGWFYWTARTEDSGVWSLLDHPEFISK